MKEMILCKLGEVVLKGLNRRSFEQKLMGNIRRRLVGLGKFKVTCLQSTIYVEAESEDADMDAAFEASLKENGWTVLQYLEDDITDGQAQAEEIKQTAKENLRAMKKKKKKK